MRQRGQTLVVSLIVIAIILVCVVVMLKGSGGAEPTMKADGRGKTVLGNTKATAEDSVCEANLKNCRLALTVQRSTDEEYKPATVAEIPGTGGISSCPVGKEPYTIDASGNIKCPHPGHGKY